MMIDLILCADYIDLVTCLCFVCVLGVAQLLTNHDASSADVLAVL